MNPADLLVLAFAELQQDYRAAEFVRTYERKGLRVELEEAEKRVWYSR